MSLFLFIIRRILGSFPAIIIVVPFLSFNGNLGTYICQAIILSPLRSIAGISIARRLSLIWWPFTLLLSL